MLPRCVLEVLSGVLEQVALERAELQTIQVECLELLNRSIKTALGLHDRLEALPDPDGIPYATKSENT